MRDLLALWGLMDGHGATRCGTTFLFSRHSSEQPTLSETAPSKQNCARHGALSARRRDSLARRNHFGMRSPSLSTNICTRSGNSLQRPSTLCVALISAQQAFSRLW